MRFSRIFRQWCVIVGSGLLLFGFQNCAKTQGMAGNSASAGVVVGVTNQFTKLTFDPALESATQKVGGASVALDLDLDSGSATYRDKANSTAKSCPLDVDHEQKLKQLLSMGRICHPDQSAAGAVNCMAVSLADIKLSNASDTDSVLLRPPVCNNGTFLCDGDDGVLRGVIQDLLNNPAPACQ